MVVTDQTMPGISGDELSRRLLKIRPDLPVILCTGFSLLMDEKRAMEIGIRRLILKPLDKETLATTIWEVFSSADPMKSSQERNR